MDPNVTQLGGGFYNPNLYSIIINNPAPPVRSANPQCVQPVSSPMISVNQFNNSADFLQTNFSTPNHFSNVQGLPFSQQNILPHNGSSTIMFTPPESEFTHDAPTIFKTRSRNVANVQRQTWSQQQTNLGGISIVNPVIHENEETPPADIDFYTSLDTPLSIQIDCAPIATPNLDSVFQQELISPNPPPKKLSFPSATTSLSSSLNRSVPPFATLNPQSAGSEILASPLTPDNGLFKMEIDPPEATGFSDSAPASSLSFSCLTNPTTLVSLNEAPKVEDVYRIDKSDVTEGPTLAELNATYEPVLDDLEDLLKEESYDLHTGEWGGFGDFGDIVSSSSAGRTKLSSSAPSSYGRGFSPSKFLNPVSDSLANAAAGCVPPKNSPAPSSPSFGEFRSRGAGMESSPAPLLPRSIGRPIATYDRKPTPSFHRSLDQSPSGKTMLTTLQKLLISDDSVGARHSSVSPMTSVSEESECPGTKTFQTLREFKGGNEDAAPSIKRFMVDRRDGVKEKRVKKARTRTTSLPCQADSAGLVTDTTMTTIGIIVTAPGPSRAIDIPKSGEHPLRPDRSSRFEEGFDSPVGSTTQDPPPLLSLKGFGMLHPHSFPKSHFNKNQPPEHIDSGSDDEIEAGSSLNSSDSWRPRAAKTRRRRTTSACSAASNVSGSSGGADKFFWQYNVQSKGPKTRRLALKVQNEDPHVLKEFQDPVLSGPLGKTAGLAMLPTGKVRKGDGNDMTPSPHRLFLIGAELDKLNSQIAALTPAFGVETGKDKMARNQARKEKNKLASRACRLKKKAQHEANKLKLFGLEHEHGALTSVLTVIRNDLLHVLHNPDRPAVPSLSTKLERLMREKAVLDPNDWVAGYTTDFVNRVLEKVEAGDTCGGLPTQSVAPSTGMDFDDD